MEEMKCNVCGSVVKPGDSFCQNCGSPIAAPEPEVQAEPEVSPVAEATPDVNTEAVEAKTEEAVEEGVPETTVLSGGNPFSMQQDDTAPAQNTASVGNAAPTSATVPPTAAQTGSMAAGPVYQQMPGSGMETNYQGTYTADAYKQPETPAKKPGKGLGIAALILGIIGLLTSCCFGGYIFGLIGTILAIVCLAKKGSKGLGISGLIISALSFLISLIITIMMLVSPAVVDQMVPDDYDYILEEFGVDDTTNSNDYGNDDYNIPEPADSDITGTNQMKVNGIVYTMPAGLSSLGLSVNSSYSDVVTDIENNGLAAGSYEFVLLDSQDGCSFWGYIENTGYDTVYSVDDLQLTGINVDNYSDNCTAYSCEVYGGITLNMTRSEVEAIIGTADGQDDGMDYYNSQNGDECLRIEYDDYDAVCALDITTY